MTAPAEGSSGVSWTLFPYVLVRIPGLPEACLEAYRHEAALALHDEARRARARLADLGAPLEGSLHDIVPRLEERDHRREVLAARRALFQGRSVAEGDWRDEVRRLDASLADALDAHAAARAALDATLRARDERFDADAADKTAALLALLGAPSFRLGLLLANRAVAEQLDRITDPRSLDKRAHQTVIRAMRYLLRAALKPTPLGFFASTAVVDARRPPAAPASLARREAIVRPNRKRYRALASAVLDRPAVRDEARVFLSPICFEDDGQLWAPEGPGPDAGYRAIPLEPAMRARILAIPREGLDRALFAERVGVSDGAVDLLVEAGVIGLDVGASEAAIDDAAAISQLLQRSAPRDPEVPAILAAIRAYEAAVEAATSLDPSARAAGIAAFERADAAMPGGDPGRGSPDLFEDTACPVDPPIPSDAWGPFLDSIALHGAGMLCPDLCPEEESLSLLFHALNPGATHVPLLRFHRQYLEVCARAGLGVDPFANAIHLHRLLDRPYRDPAAAIHDDLLSALEAARGEDVVVRPDAARFAGWDAAESMRISLRFAPAPPGPRGPRFHLIFWGSDRMSLFPRYADLPHPNRDALASAFRAWMARWPLARDIHTSLGGSVDVREVFTDRVLDAPNVRPRPGGTALRDLLVSADGPGGRLRLVDRAGEAITALFLGVSAPQRQPAIIRFLAHLSGHRTSFLELASRALNRILLERLASPPREPIRFPAVYLGDHILLSPPVVLLDPRLFARFGATVDRAGFFAFHDCLADHGLPRLAQVRVDGRDPLAVDLAHPEGVSSFLRFVRGAQIALVYPPVAPDLGLCAPEGTYAVEYYAELCAGARGSPR